MNNLSQFFDTQSEHNLKVTELVDNMNLLKSLSVEEYTFYKKWEDINYNFNQEVSNLRLVKNRIWRPYDINDEAKTISQIESLSPKIILVDSENIYEWNTIRAFCSSMTFDANIGRNLKFLVVDEHTNAYLGCLSVGSDVIAINARDTYIGWTKEDRLEKGKLNNIAIGTSIIPTQPLGYNFLGGKLMACLVTSKFIRDLWKSRYEDLLVGMTTTSLYGSYSMYDSIPYWKSVGSSNGSVLLKPDDKIYKYWHNYIKTQFTDQYDNAYNADNAIGVTSGVKQKIMSMILKEVGLTISNYKHGYERGVYFAPFYENTKDFLCGKISEAELKPLPKYQSDVDGMLSWWKEKAIRRYKKLKSEGRLDPSTLFYDDLFGTSWKEAKTMYIDKVGR